MHITKEDIGSEVWSITHGWGTIISVEENYVALNPFEAVVVEFGSCGMCDSFSVEGFSLKEDITPFLFGDKVAIVAPPRPKKKVKREVCGWVNIEEGGFVLPELHESREKAQFYGKAKIIACIELKGFYEV